MRSLVEDELRFVNAVSLNFLLGVGGIGTLVFLYTAVTGTGLVSTVFPAGVIEFLLLGVPAVGLLYAGYWLRSAAFEPVQVWRIGQYALAGALIATLVVTVIAAQVPGWPAEAKSLLFLLVSTGTEGALVGVLVGTFAATDLLGSELDRVRAGLNGSVAASDGAIDDGAGGPDVPDGPDDAGDADGRASGEVDDLLAALSHDLRNPLNVARLRVELAREDGDLDHLDAVVRAHDRMETLIEETLTLARETGGSIEATPVTFREVAEDAWQNVDTDDATLVVETDRTVTADRERLIRLLENLFRNSVEHGSTSSRPPADDSVEHGSTGSRTASGDSEGRSPSGSAAPPHDSVEHDSPGDATVTVRVGATEDGFYVADDGPGIPPGQREKVFGTGYSTREGGTGLGLAIVSRIAEEHGWDVHVTESDDGGARFEFTGVRSRSRGDAVTADHTQNMNG